MREHQIDNHFLRLLDRTRKKTLYTSPNETRASEHDPFTKKTTVNFRESWTL
jgi:hypothetical protein